MKFIQSQFGIPNHFSPMDRGLVLEDVWTSLYYGRDRLPEMRRKIEEHEWARDSLELMKSEAEFVLKEEPRFSTEKAGGRSCLIREEGHACILDATQSHHFYDPHFVTEHEHDESSLSTWSILQHERLRRLMTSMSFLYGMTGDERYSRWVWEGLRSLAYDIYDPEVRGEQKKYRCVYTYLYGSQALVHIVQTLENVAEAPGSDPKDLEFIHEHVLRDSIPPYSSWVDLMDTHNMTCWTMAGLGITGEYLGDDELVLKALTKDRSGLHTLIQTGLPLDPETGKADGFWFEASTFYNFYAVIPLLGLSQVAKRRDLLPADLEERLHSAFEAPLHLSDQNLGLVSYGDRISPDWLSLSQVAYYYEYAAGLYPDKYGHVLAEIYDHGEATRNSLAALAWGPDKLPAPKKLQREHTRLGAAKLAVFRGETRRGEIAMWFFGGNDAKHGCGHHHWDKLSLSLHVEGDILTSDLGLPYKGDDYEAYLRGSFSHNTLFLDEVSQGPMTSTLFETHFDAETPWARARVTGNTELFEKITKTMEGRGDDTRAGVYDGAELERALLFDHQTMVLIDRFDCPEERRCCSSLNIRGDMVYTTQAAEGPVGAELPDLPKKGSFAVFSSKITKSNLKSITLDWKIRTSLWLRATTICSQAFEAKLGKTPDCPSDLKRSSVLLRTAAKRCWYVTVLEIHRGQPKFSQVDVTDQNIDLQGYKISKSYSIPFEFN